MVTAPSTIPLFFFSYSSSFITPSVFTISSPCAAQKHVLHIIGNVSGVCDSQFTHPLGPGLCPCVKRQSLLGGFCCEDNRRCNMNAMFHCFNSETFLRCIFRFKRFCFVTDTSVCVCACLCFCLRCRKSFPVRLNKGLQMATNVCMLRHPFCSKSCGA